MMGEDSNLPSSNINTSIDNSHVLQAEHLYKQDSTSVCAVILDSSDVTYFPILPIEAGEEVVVYEDVQEKVKEEIDVCSDSYQDVYTEVYDPQTVNTVEKKSQPKNSRQGPHKCRICHKAFAQVVNLVTHERIHTGEKPFKCKVCMKSFSQQPNLWKHMRTHTGERPYVCEICHKSFTQQANLTKHIRIHTGERPYSCEYCEKRFTQQANLTKHVRLHTGERPFHCRYCPKTFVQQSNLERHERTHTGSRPFKCKICYDSFAQNAHLAKHVRTIHKKTEKPVQLKVRRREELSHTSIESENRHEVVLNDQYEASSTKKIGIPVLYCTKTGRIIKRID